MRGKIHVKFWYGIFIKTISKHNNHNPPSYRVPQVSIINIINNDSIYTLQHELMQAYIIKLFLSGFYTWALRHTAWDGALWFYLSDISAAETAITSLPKCSH